jgi:hypothetical protein
LKTRKSFMNSLSITAGIVGALLSLSTASATTIPAGVVNFAGTVTVNSGGVFFANGASVAHLIDAGTPDTGAYNGLTGGTIKDLVTPIQIGTLTTPINQFLTFNTSTGPVLFDLTAINPGVGTVPACTSNATGSVCTPPGSPFTLTQLSTGAVGIQLSLSGIAYTGSSSTGTDATIGVFTTQNTNPGSITGILAAVAGGGITNSYSATFSSVPPGVIPEPGTYVLLGLGLISVASIRKRTRKV